MYMTRSTSDPVNRNLLFALHAECYENQTLEYQYESLTGDDFTSFWKEAPNINTGR